MAFNPFDLFRRNQRILFAILTVIIMFMFVLSSGVGSPGDLEQWLPDLISRKVKSGDALATVDGTTVYKSDLDTLAVNRVLANEYMARAAVIDTDRLAEAVRAQADKAGPDARPVLQELVSTRASGYVDFRMLSQFPPQYVEQLMPTLQQNAINQFQQRLGQIATAKDSKPADVTAARMGLKLLTQDLLARRQYAAGQYFINQPNQTARDQMNFYLWRKKADELGIAFTTADTESLIKSEFGDRLTNEDWIEVEKQMSRKSGYSPELLRAAIGDEFRVRTAQTAVLGDALVNTLSTDRLYASPYQYYDYYADQLSPARYGLIAVPAENFVPEVNERPTEAELLRLFKQYSRKEPAPYDPTPGFTAPRRLKVAWLEATGKEPYYQQKAERLFPKSGAMPVELAALVGGVSATADPLLQKAYDRYADAAESRTENEWFKTAGYTYEKKSPVLDTHMVRPQVMATLAAAVAGSLLTTATPFDVALAMEQTMTATEFTARAKALATLLSPGVAVGDPLGAAAAFAACVPDPLPLAVVQPQLVDEVRTSLAYQLAGEDLRAFQLELEKLKSNPTAAREYTDKFVKERNLTFAETDTFRDQYAIGDEPALAPLKAKAAGTHGGNVDAIQFGRRFFFAPQPGGREVATAGLFQPEPYPNQVLTNPSETDPALLVWRTAEIEADAPKSLDAKGVRDRVVAAWKLGKAKELARKAAEELAAKARKAGDNQTVIEQKLQDLKGELAGRFTDPAAQARVKYFPIDDVAPLVKKPTLTPGRYEVSDFGMKRSDDISFPSQSMTEELLNGRDKPLSTSFVTTNRPEDVYYATTLIRKGSLSDEDFARDVFNSPIAFGNEVVTELAPRHQRQLAVDARNQAIELIQIEFDYKDESPEGSGALVSE